MVVGTDMVLREGLNFLQKALQPAGSWLARRFGIAWMADGAGGNYSDGTDGKLVIENLELVI